MDAAQAWWPKQDDDDVRNTDSAAIFVAIQSLNNSLISDKVIG